MSRCTCHRRNQWEYGECDYCAYEDICPDCKEYESSCKCKKETE